MMYQLKERRKTKARIDWEFFWLTGCTCAGVGIVLVALLWGIP